MKPPIPATEPQRLEALQSYAVLDTLPEVVYDDITYLASQICDAPIALISLVDGNRQWFKSKVGLDVAETPRNLAFCAHAIMNDDLMVVPDAQADERFANNPLVTGQPDIRFYAGAPLITGDGDGLGTLCVIDRKPRELSETQRRSLEALSRQVMGQLELRKALADLSKLHTERAGYQEKLEAYQRELETVNEELRRETLTDALTGLMSRRAFQEALDMEIDRAARYETPLSLALIDIDHFKPFNDTFGHLDGDEVLKEVARQMVDSSRASDMVGRIGGEEFGIILPNTTAANAFVLAERCRLSVEQADWPQRAITISLGIATYDRSIGGRSDFMRVTDCALYEAKDAGRNCVMQTQALPSDPALDPDEPNGQRFRRHTVPTMAPTPLPGNP